MYDLDTFFVVPTSHYRYWAKIFVDMNVFVFLFIWIYFKVFVNDGVENGNGPIFVSEYYLPI